MDRRTYLKSAGTAIGSCVLASTGVAAIDYDRTVNIVEAGADPTGSQPIDGVFQRVAEDGTLVEFPEGEYLVNQLSLWGLKNFGMRATGDATLVPGADYHDKAWVGGSETENLLVEGFTLDTTEEGVSPSMEISSLGGLIVRDILKRGAQDGGNKAFGFRVTNPDGSGLIENVRAPDGDVGGDSVGMYVNTTGPLTIRDCRIEEFGNNGLYASGSSGPVRVEGGFYRNNDVTSIRLSSPGSYVKSTDIVVEDPAKDDGNYRGIRVSDGPGPVTIEDVDIDLRSGQGSGGVVAAYSGGSFDLRNSRIHVSPDYTIVGSDETTSYAIWIDEATDIDDPGERTIQNVSITGGGTRFPAIDLNRDDNTVEGCQIQQDGDGRDGINVAAGAVNNRVVNCAIEVTGEQITGDGEVYVEGLTDTATPEEVGIDLSLGGDDSRADGNAGSVNVEVQAEANAEKETSQAQTPTKAKTESSTPTQPESSAETTDSDDETETEKTQTDDEAATTAQTTEAAESAAEPATKAETETKSETETETTTKSKPETETETETESESATYPVSTPENDEYATMGTSDDLPTATIWTGLHCSYSAKFAGENLQAIVDELVRSGDLRIRQRTLPYDLDDPSFPGIDEAKGGVLAAEYALAVWNVDPDSYWAFYTHLYEKLRDGQWADEELLNQYLREVGVENRDAVRARVEDGRYHSNVEQTANRAEELGIDIVPRISFQGETIPARLDTDVVLDWLRERL